MSRGLVCIAQLHCFTGCNANSGFYGKGKVAIYNKVAKSPVAQQQISLSGNSLDLEEQFIRELVDFTRKVIYNDKQSNG